MGLPLHRTRRMCAPVMWSDVVFTSRVCRLIHAAAILASFLLPWTLRKRVWSMDQSCLPCRKDARSPAVCMRPDQIPGTSACPQSKGQFLCQASRNAQVFRKALSEKGHRPRSSAEGMAPCQRRRAQGLPGASRLAPAVGGCKRRRIRRTRSMRIVIAITCNNNTFAKDGDEAGRLSPV